jgi:hypothetical protein
MKQHYFFTSVTRNADFSEAPFDVEPLDRSQWSTGDFVVGRVIGKRNRLYRCETRVGRMADMVRGDLMVGALGERAATLEGVGNWQAVGDDLEMEALTPAGLIGKATSTSVFLPEFMRLQYLGHVKRNDVNLGMMDFVGQAEPAVLEMPAILLIGTSMSSGKTTSGQVIIRALNYLGKNVAAAKFTGAARYRDILSFRDAGANHVFDFVDAGLPSTVCSESRCHIAIELLTSRAASTGADVLVVEAGASPLEPYNGEIVMNYLRDANCFTVLCASDPYAVLGVQYAFGNHLQADLVAGPAANTDAAVALVKKLTGLRALNLQDRANHPELLELLKKALVSP